MKRHRILEVADSLLHFLYRPTMLGRGLAIARWHHRIHLIPHWLVKPICDRYDASLWAAFRTPEEEAEQRAIARRRTPPESWREDWDCPEDAVYDDPGRRITDEINTDPAEVERLRRSREQARKGEIYGR